MKHSIRALMIGMLVMPIQALGNDAGMRYPAEMSGGQDITTAAESRAAGIVSIIVEREPDTRSVAGKIGAVIARSWGDTEVLEVPAEQAEAVKALLRITPGVESVEADAVVSAPTPHATEAPDSSVQAQSSPGGPNDPENGDQFWWRSVDDYAGASNLEKAWSRSLVNERLSVVVIDGGFDNHPDFNWTSGISLVNDGRGYLSYDSEACNSYHGQSVASIIGAVTDNGRGMAGALDADLHAARVLACDSSGYLSDVARALRWAAGKDIGEGEQLGEPADVINLSLGAETQCSDTLQSAIDTANRAGATVVVSAGNNSSDAGDYAPASCDGVVTVGAVTLQGNQASFSNYGAALDVSALGQQILVQGPDGHRWMSGTSFSAPIVSSIIGLIRQDIPELDAETLHGLLREATTPLSRRTNDMGAGILNAALLQQEVAALLGNDEPSLHHAMAIRVDDEGRSPFWEHLDESRLCNLHEFQANAQSRRTGEVFRLFRVSDGDAMTVSNGEVVGEGTDERFLLTGLTPNDYEYGLQLCDGDQCRDNSLIELNSSRMQPPARCR